MGVDLNPAKALTDAGGKVLFHAQTGGMVAPQRYEIMPGATLFRFASGGANALAAMAGGWWLMAAEFERVQRFAQSIRSAIRSRRESICGVPPE